MERLLAQSNFMKRVLPQHTIIKKIGKGGFGEVFLTEHKMTQELTALKLMYFSPTEGEESTQKRRARFKREMKLTTELQHPNIVTLLDHGECEQSNLLYSLFEYIPGKTLADIIKKEGALTMKRAFSLMQQTLEAIVAAHSKGVIHRDLKPENILITEQNGKEEVKIFDFGISTFNPAQRSDITRLTITREFLGTPLYSAPEQLRGEPVTVKSDLYAWGLLFLECLTGKHPYSGNSIAEIVQKQLSHSQVPLPLTLTNHPLGTFLSWILNKETQRRGGDAKLILSRFTKLDYDPLCDLNGFLTNSKELTTPMMQAGLLRDTQKGTKKSERRQITALSLELGISSGGVMKEDILDEIYHNLLEICCETIEDAGGHIEGQVYDKVNALFGYPEIHGRDVHRAARTGLELYKSLTQRSRILLEEQQIQLTFSLAMHTGMVTIRESKRGNRIVGVTPSVAGQLCSAAPDKSFILSAESYKLLQSMLQCEECKLPNIEEPAYSVIEERCGELQNRKTISLTGRETELTMLREHYDTQSSPILLTGEAGIGKSRLTSEMISYSQDKENPFMEYRCLPEGQNSALYPIFAQLRRDIAPDISTSEISQLASYIAKLGLATESTMPYLCLWLGIDHPEYRPPIESPKMQKEHIVNTILAILKAESQNNQTLHIFEDLHWADPTTIEVITKFAEEAKKSNIFFMLTGRPDFVSPWKKSLITQLNLERMSDEQIKEIILNTTETVSLPPSLVEQMVERSDGIPLFAEELARMFLESGIRETRSTHESENFLVPDSLKELLSSKLNRLGIAKETAQLAATLGRHFDYNLLAQVSTIDESVLLADLDQLVSAGIINIQYRADDNPHYYFRHSLVRDAAYNSMTSLMRRELHKSVATILSESSSGDESQLWQTAWHFSQAEMMQEAIDFGLQSVTIASQKAHYLETINTGKELLQWIGTLPESENSAEQTIAVTQVLISAYSSYYSFSYGEIEHCFEATNTLLQKLPRESKYLFPALWSRVFYYYTKAAYSTSEQFWEEAYSASNNEPAYMAALHCYKSNFERLQGNFKSSLTHAEKAVAFYDKAADFDYAHYLGHNIKVLALFTKSLTLSLTGSITDAKENMEQTVAFAKGLNSISSIGQAMVYKLLMLVQQDDKEAVITNTQHLRPFLSSHAQGFLLPLLEMLYGWATDDHACCAENFRIISSHGFAQPASFFNFLVARTAYKAGKLGEALSHISPFIDDLNEQWELFYAPELLNLKAKIELQKGETEEASETLQKALQVSQDAGSKLFTLRILLTSLRIPARKEECTQLIKALVEEAPQLKATKEYEAFLQMK